MIQSKPLNHLIKKPLHWSIPSSHLFFSSNSTDEAIQIQANQAQRRQRVLLQETLPQKSGVPKPTECAASRGSQWAQQNCLN